MWHPLLKCFARDLAGNILPFFFDTSLVIYASKCCVVLDRKTMVTGSLLHAIQ
jgi:hypothetical protein